MKKERAFIVGILMSILATSFYSFATHSPATQLQEAPNRNEMIKNQNGNLKLNPAALSLAVLCDSFGIVCCLAGCFSGQPCLGLQLGLGFCEEACPLWCIGLCCPPPADPQEGNKMVSNPKEKLLGTT